MWRNISCGSVKFTKSINLDQLICGRIKHVDFESLTNDTIDDQCTNLGQRISKSLIRVAATRIFSNPEQSIMELPVNSIDAYRGNNSIGKFGMGFFFNIILVNWTSSS